MESICERGRF